MNYGTITKLALSACLAASCVAAVGCASGASTAATASQQANRAYMSQVNETMVELDEALDQFTDAVSRGDVVNMRTQADNAYKTLDKLSKSEAPEDLKGIKDSYVEGAAKLREALDAYIALYTDMSAKDSDVDKAAYDERLASIQKLYDEGVAALQKGDEQAASDGSSSSEAASPASGASEASASAATEAAASDSAASDSSSTAANSSAASAA